VTYFFRREIKMLRGRGGGGGGEEEGKRRE
jgi:hypothetical protein